MSHNYLLPKRPDSIMAKFQKLGFFRRKITSMIRDTVLFCIMFFSIFYYSSLSENNFVTVLWSLLAFAILYIIIFMIVEGIILRIIALAFTLAILSFLAIIFPPLGIVVAIIVFLISINKFISLLSMIPWALLSFPFYIICYFSYKYQTYNSYWFIALIFVLFISILAASRYSFRYSLFYFSIMYGTVPILILIYLFDTDSDIATTGFDVTDGYASIDANGLRIDFPGGTYARWVEPMSGAAHWRIYN
jgi:hypothetical protein